MTEHRSVPASEVSRMLQRRRREIRSRLERDAVVGARVVHAWLTAKTLWRARIARMRLQRHGGRSPLDLGRPLTVDPAAVRRCSLLEFDARRYRDAVVGGDWDLSTKLFTDLDVYEAMRIVLHDRAARWEDTEWYRRCLRRIAAGEMLWGCRDEAELRRRLDGVAALYDDIETHGYLSQDALARLRPAAATGDEIGVAVGRTGELLFCDGAHRLCVAKLLGLKEVPVQVAVRHPLWDRLRTDLIAYAAAEGGRLYQPAAHPDLACIPSEHACVDRWEVVRAALPATPGTALDVGANLGYFSSELERLGWRCTAVENDPALVRFLRALRDANGLGFEVVAGSVVGAELAGRHFDLVLALNVLHHFLKTRQEFLSLSGFLSGLDCEELIIESHGPADDAQMAGAYAPMSPDELVAWVASLTGHDVVTKLCVMADRRPLYRLSRGGTSCA